ncbi:MAG: tetratricopeptide repeat protein, partial [Cyanobacteria bacterium P01_A01_bin.83]
IAPYYSYEWIKALRIYHQELLAQQQLKDYEAQGNIYKKIAYAYSALGVIQRKIEYYQYAIQAYNQVNNRIAPAFIFNKLGEAYLEYGELEEAEKYLQLAYWAFQEQLLDLNINNKFKYDSDVGNNLSFLAQVSLLKGQYAQAISYAEQAKDFRISNNNRFNLGKIYLQAGQAKKAIEYFDNPTELCRKNRASYRSIPTLNDLARAYMIEGNISKAIDCYNLALNASKKDNIDRADSYLGLGKASSITKNKNKDKAIFYFLEALNIYQQTNSIKNIFKIHEALRSLGNIHEKSNNLNRAIFYYEQSLALAFEAKYLLREAYPQQFYHESNATLEKLLLLLTKTKQVNKYSQWYKRKNSFKFNHYLKVKQINDFSTDSQQKIVVTQWKKKLQELKYAYQNIPDNVYYQDCKVREARYIQLRQELKNFIGEISQKHPDIAELLQIDAWQLQTVYPNTICKERPPSIYSPYIF